MKNKSKKNGALSYVKYSAMQQRINEFGFSLSLKKYLFLLLIATVVCFVVAMLFKLKPAYTLMVAFSFLFCTPLLVVFRFKFNYQQKKFAEVTLYLQQMAYSFKRKNKILNALVEVEKLTSGKINKRINEAIDYIKAGQERKKGMLFKEALEIIENSYKCSRIKTLHTFMIEVETYGGEYRRTLNTLIKDIENWIARTMSYQENRKHMQQQTTVSIIMSLCLCMAVTYILPEEISNVTELFNSTEYQIMTLISLIGFVIFYIVVLAKTSSSWLDLEDLKNDYTMKDIERDYQFLTSYNVDKHTVKNLFIACVLGIAGLLAYMLTRNAMIIISVLIVAIMIVLNPRFTMKRAKKRLQNDLMINFPNWIRSLVLLLQTNNLQVALQKSLPECTGALKIEVARLIKNIEADPVSQQPYLLFMEYFEAYKIKSILRSLYGMSEYGQNEAIEQINAIIMQNDEVAAVSEKLSDNLKISGMQLYILMPMLLGTFNMFINLFIFGSSFFTFFNVEGFI